jgi:hypothetical protein
MTGRREHTCHHLDRRRVEHRCVRWLHSSTRPTLATSAAVAVAEYRYV